MKRKNLIFIDYNDEYCGFNVLHEGKRNFIGEEVILYMRFGFIEYLINTGQILMNKAYEIEKEKQIDIVVDNDVQFVHALLSIDKEPIEKLKRMIDA